MMKAAVSHDRVHMKDVDAFIDGECGSRVCVCMCVCVSVCVGVSLSVCVCVCVCVNACVIACVNVRAVAPVRVKVCVKIFFAHVLLHSVSV